VVVSFTSESAALYPPGRFLVLISVRGWVDSRDAGSISSIEKSNDLIENRNRDLPACIVFYHYDTACPKVVLWWNTVLYTGEELMYHLNRMSWRKRYVYVYIYIQYVYLYVYKDNRNLKLINVINIHLNVIQKGTFYGLVSWRFLTWSTHHQTVAWLVNDCL
jgi:hypothetical protein